MRARAEACPRYGSASPRRMLSTCPRTRSSSAPTRCWRSSSQKRKYARRTSKLSPRRAERSASGISVAPAAAEHASRNARTRSKYANERPVIMHVTQVRSIWSLGSVRPIHESTWASIAIAPRSAASHCRYVSTMWSGARAVTAFLEAVTARAPDQIVDTYRQCDATDRGGMAMDPHVLSWIGRTLPNDQVLRTCVICMITGRSFVFFERVRAFLLACSAAAGATELPEALRAALRGLTFEVRLAYFRFCEDDRRQRVGALEEGVRGQVLAILRGDAEA